MKSNFEKIKKDCEEILNSLQESNILRQEQKELLVLYAATLKDAISKNRTVLNDSFISRYKICVVCTLQHFSNANEEDIIKVVDNMFSIKL